MAGYNPQISSVATRTEGDQGMRDGVDGASSEDGDDDDHSKNILPHANVAAGTDDDLVMEGGGHSDASESGTTSQLPASQPASVKDDTHRNEHPDFQQIGSSACISFAKGFDRSLLD